MFGNSKNAAACVQNVAFLYVYVHFYVFKVFSEQWHNQLLLQTWVIAPDSTGLSQQFE